jgi:hypothetical protein
LTGTFGRDIFDVAVAIGLEADMALTEEQKAKRINAMKLARQVAPHLSFPIENWDQAIHELGGEEAIINYLGQSHKISEHGDLLRTGSFSHYFPIQSPKDLGLFIFFVLDRLRPPGSPSG